MPAPILVDEWFVLAPPPRANLAEVGFPYADTLRASVLFVIAVYLPLLADSCYSRYAFSLITLGLLALRGSI